MATSPPDDTAPFSVGERRMTVLLVDDDESMVEMSASFLSRELGDIETTSVTDPELAFAELQRGGYDCVVSDFDMPDMNGLELLKEVRSEDDEVPFVLFTGKGSEEIASQAITAGVDEYLQKGGPEKYPVLANKVETLVEKHWAEAQVRRAFSAIESAEEGIGILNDNGTYEYLNEAYAAVYDRDREEIVGQHWDMLYPADETQRFHDDILPELEAKGTWRGISTGVTKGGEEVSERLILTQMQDGGHVCIVQKVEEESELKAELALKNRALDATDIGITITDATADDNPIVYLNEGFEELTGYSEEEALGENWRFFQGPDTDSDTVTAIEETIEHGTSLSTEVLNYADDGSPFRSRLDIYPVHGPDGGVTNFICFQHKIGDGQNHEAETERQLEWLAEFGRVLSHDLKTPLSVIQGNLQLTRESGYLEYLDDAYDAMERMGTLIDDLANVLATGELVNTVEPVELADVFRSWDSFATTPEALDVIDSKPLLADEQAFIRLADNLVKNTVEHAGEDVPMRIGTLPDGFYYEDSGPGIPEAMREKVFKPGFTTKEGGAGFGMVSIRQIAMAHGWSVSITESADGGVRFEFTGVASPE